MKTIKSVVDDLLENYYGTEDAIEQDCNEMPEKCAEQPEHLSPEEKKLVYVREELVDSLETLKSLIHSVNCSISDLKSFNFPQIGGAASNKNRLGKAVKEFSLAFEAVKSNASDLITDWGIEAGRISKQLAEMQDDDGDLDTVSS